MNVGVVLPLAESDGPGRMPGWTDVLAFARHAEAAGLDSVWVFDHFYGNAPGGPVEGMLEPWTILSALAASTRRVELGQVVMCTAYRNPGLLAKMATTADAVSEGRLVLGLGAGWHDQEYEAFGYPVDHRFSRFEEALAVVEPLLRGESVTLEGRFVHVRDAVLVPAPDRRIPIMIAGRGPRMLRLTARHADAWNTAWFGAPDDRLRERLADLERALEAEGRDPSTLRRTIGLEVLDPDTRAPDGEPVPFGGTVDELARVLDAHEALGFQDAIVVLQPMNEASIDRLARAVELRTR